MVSHYLTDIRRGLSDTLFYWRDLVYIRNPLSCIYFAFSCNYKVAVDEEEAEEAIE